MNTHSYLNTQGINLLERDGYVGMSTFLKKNIVWIEKGSKWADSPQRYIEHYLLPIRGKGLWCWPNAGIACERYFNEAVKFWRQGNTGLAMFYLGAALHLVQDLCVPYHAHGKVFDGHRRFEFWASNNKELFAICRGGRYEKSCSAFKWVYNNACEAHPLYWSLKESYFEVYPFAVQKMLFLAQQTTAGFLHNYFHYVM